MIVYPKKKNILMNKILVIPDTHCRKFWRKAIFDNADKVDKVIFLGDYLDPYQNEIEENPELMECDDFYDSENLLKMLEDIISLKKNESNKYILLTGNHTDSYIWPEFSAATRTDKMNWKKYHNFFLENLDYFNLVWIENDMIFSHAGISEEWADDFLYSSMKYNEGAELEKGSVVFETARVLMDTPLKYFNKYYIDSISHISRYRGGDFIYGSCEWADIREHIKEITSYEKSTFIGKGEEGTFQIFGHTQCIKPLICDKWACLDCRKGFIVDTVTHEIS